MSEVNQVNMARWIVALRSGKYKQACAALRTDDAFCCLGVVCDVSGVGEWLQYSYVTPNGKSDIRLPEPVAVWLGTTDNPPLESGLGCIAANDRLNWSFTQIADALESRYLPNTTAEKILAEQK